MAPPPPKCRFCGKNIPKRTKIVLFGRPDRTDDHYWVTRQECPKTRDEAQRLFNDGDIVSIRWAEGKGGERWISQAGLWDRESYRSPYFCNGDHAKSFAYVVARDRPALICYDPKAVS